MLKLTFLGTSSGVPTKQRNVSGLAVECINSYLSSSTSKNKKNRPWILVDCGEGTQHQLLHTNISVNQLQAICITHVHGDHCYGLAGLLASMAMSGRKSSLKIIAPRAISKLLDTLTITTELYFPYEIEFLAIEDFFMNKTDDQIETGNTAKVHLALSNEHSVDIDMVALSHRVDSFAFTFTESITRKVLDNEKLLSQGIEPCDIWGKLKNGHDVSIDNKDSDGSQILKSSDYLSVGVEHIKIVISGDNDTPDLLADTVKGATLLVHESTYTQAVADKIHAREDSFDPQHTTAKEVAQFAQNNQLPHMILTHFSARYQLHDNVADTVANMGHVRAEVSEYYDGNYKQQFWLAEDFDEYDVTVNGVYKIS